MHCATMKITLCVSKRSRLTMHRKMIVCVLRIISNKIHNICQSVEFSDVKGGDALGHITPVL